MNVRKHIVVFPAVSIFLSGKVELPNFSKNFFFAHNKIEEDRVMELKDKIHIPACGQNKKKSNLVYRRYTAAELSGESLVILRIVVTV